MVLENAGGLRQAKVVRESQGNSKALSQVVVLGNKYRLFFKLRQQDAENGIANIITAAVPGRRLDKDVCGRSFIVLEDIEVLPTGKFNDKSGLSVYQRIAKVLFRAKERWEINRAERDAKEGADALGEEVNKEELGKTIREIKEKYEGDPDHKPEPIYATLSPAIGGLVVDTATECLVVPLDANGAPKFQDAQTASLSINKKRENQLLAILDNPDYFNISDGYLEVGYAYTGATKAEAGTAATFQGIANGLHLVEKFTDCVEDLKKNLDRLANTPLGIASRNFNMNSNITPEEVVSKLVAYCSTQRAIFAHIDYEDKNTAYAAKDMLDSGIVKGLNKVIEQLEALVKANEEENAESEGAVENTAGEEAAAAIKDNRPEDLRSLQQIVPDIDAASETVGELEGLGDEP